MGFRHLDYLSSSEIYGCACCRTHLSTREAVVSKQFTGQTGPAYLFSSVVNVVEGEAEDRPMTTGLHTVRDISCSKCGAVLGWKYDKAYEEVQKYKEGKYILETKLTVKVH